MGRTPGGQADQRVGPGVARRWWRGLALNLVLSLLYLLLAPLTAVPHRDWAILVGSHFAAFLLADSTTTNALGLDAERVSRELDDAPQCEAFCWPRT